MAARKRVRVLDEDLARELYNQNDSHSDVSNSDDELFQDDFEENNSDSGEDIPLLQGQRDRVRPRPIHDVSDSDFSDESQDEADLPEVEGRMWTIPRKDKAPTIEDFTGLPGVNVDIPYPETPWSTASLFLTNELFELLVVETNRYKSQTNPNPTPNTKTLNWRDVSLSEMKKVIGLWILTGQVKKNTICDYWSTDSLLTTPVFPRTKSRNRFEDIMRYLHFTDNAAQPQEQNRLYKIQAVLDIILGASRTLYTPGRELSLDEAMVAWRGRLVFRTYNPGKLTKYGILVRAVCESSTGYVANLQVYTARGTKLEDTILRLCEPFYNNGYHVYMDNYYNSVSISESLLTHGIRVCGTIRKNRGLPKEFAGKALQLKKGENVLRRCKDVLLHAWRDKRVVHMVSTIHAGEMTTCGDNREGEPVVKPQCILEYNKFMGGVDRADQYMAYYPFMRKTIKWTKNFFLFLIMLGLFNSFIIYKKINEGRKRLSFRKYLLEVSRSLLTYDFHGDIADSGEDDEDPYVARRYSPAVDPTFRLSGDMATHELIPIPATEKKKYAMKQCKVCKMAKIRAETRYVCRACNVPLHKIKCFKKYHTCKKY